MSSWLELLSNKIKVVYRANLFVNIFKNIVFLEEEIAKIIVFLDELWFLLKQSKSITNDLGSTLSC